MSLVRALQMSKRRLNREQHCLLRCVLLYMSGTWWQNSIQQAQSPWWQCLRHAYFRFWSETERAWCHWTPLLTRTSTNAYGATSLCPGRAQRTADATPGSSFLRREMRCRAPTAGCLTQLMVSPPPQKENRWIDCQLEVGTTLAFLLSMSHFKFEVSFGFLSPNYMGLGTWFFVKPQNGLVWLVAALVVFSRFFRHKIGPLSSNHFFSKLEAFYDSNYSLFFRSFEKSKKTMIRTKLLLVRASPILLSARKSDRLPYLHWKLIPVKIEAPQKGLRPRQASIWRDESKSAVYIFVGALFTCFKMRGQKWITQNIQGRVGFSLPRAFQRWSENCSSPCGFFGN